MPQEKTFVANPFFDEVMIFYGNTILTHQDKLKQIKCELCNRPNLYEKREKENKSGYINDVQAKLRHHLHPDWPFKGDVMVKIIVLDSASRLNSVDLDNLSKSILDSLKGIVFESRGSSRNGSFSVGLKKDHGY